MQLFLSSDFNIRSLRRKPQSTAQKMKAWQEKLQLHHLTTISRILASYIPQSLFDQHVSTANSRRRIFSTENTFWGFFLQTLKADSSCQSIVHQFRVNVRNYKTSSISTSTSAYCQARKRLSLHLLTDIFRHTSQYNDQQHPLVNRRVVCADGTGLLAADTQPNQNMWPQQASQKEGCGFPQIRLCGLFNLHTGTALSYRLGNKRSHELPLLRNQEQHFKKDDIFIGDKGFICFYDQARLMMQGVDSIVALAKRKPVSANAAERCLGKNDLLISIPKFTSNAALKRYPKDRWDSLPDNMKMRQIKVEFAVPGYRSQSVYLLTTLLDEKVYPAELIAELYKQRWRIELYFRDMKTTLGMEMLRGKTPEMVEKEIQMFFIVYNLLRLLILDSVTDKSPDTFAFKSCIQTLLAYHDSEGFLSKKSKAKYLEDLKSKIARCILFQRPGRVEPRQIKRRPKPFKLMTKPRTILKAELIA